MFGSRIPMDGIWTEGRDANGNIFSAIDSRGAVADPLAAAGDDGLAGLDLDHAVLGLDAQRSAQHDGELVEFRPLARLAPS